MTPERVARRLELDELYAEYAQCLDADELERWPDFFIEDCAYHVTTAENYAAGLPIGLIHLTSRAMLQDRVAALREANIYEPQRYRHLISGIRIVSDGAAGLDLAASFAVVRTMQDGAMMLFAAGQYLDAVRRADGAWKFARKTVVLDSRRIDTLLAIPL